MNTFPKVTVLKDLESPYSEDYEASLLGWHYDPTKFLPVAIVVDEHGGTPWMVPMDRIEVDEA